MLHTEIKFYRMFEMQHYKKLEGLQDSEPREKVQQEKKLSLKYF
jgi:hypothetical protein